jgi:hypothetical protein
MAFEYDKTSSFIVSNDHHFRKDDPLFHCTCCLSEKFIALAKDSDARSYGFDGFRRRTRAVRQFGPIGIVNVSTSESSASKILRHSGLTAAFKSHV